MRWSPGGPEPPRTWPLWEALAARLRASAELDRLLDPYKGQVFGPDEDESAMDDLAAPWARVVILPASVAFQPQDTVQRDRVVGCLVRVDVRPPHGRFSSMRVLEAIHAEVWRQLRGWTPGPLPFGHVGLPMWRESAPQSVALWDEGSGTHYLSCEYQAVLEPPLEIPSGE